MVDFNGFKVGQRVKFLSRRCVLNGVSAVISRNGKNVLKYDGVKKEEKEFDCIVERNGVENTIYGDKSPIIVLAPDTVGEWFGRIEITEHGDYGSYCNKDVELKIIE